MIKTITFLRAGERGCTCRPCETPLHQGAAVSVTRSPLSRCECGGHGGLPLYYSSVEPTRSVAVSNRGVRRAERKHRTCMVLCINVYQGLSAELANKNPDRHIHHPKVSTVCMCCRSKQPAVSRPWFADDLKESILSLLSMMLHTAAPRNGTRSAEACLL